MRTFRLPACFRFLSLTFLSLLILTSSALPSAAQAVTPVGTPTPWRAQNRAGLVVRFADGGALTRCVHFSSDTIGGDELLELSGLELAINTDGAVCAIGGQGCPADDCFCQCPFPDCQYWAYYHLSGTAWRHSEIGPYGWMIRDGEVDGWAWGPGDFSQGVLPPVIPFEQICPADAVTPWPTATFNFTPTPHATLTPVPTATATPPPPPPPAEIPEPATLLLLAPGLVALGAWVASARRRRL